MQVQCTFFLIDIFIISLAIDSILTKLPWSVNAIGKTSINIKKDIYNVIKLTNKNVNTKQLLKNHSTKRQHQIKYRKPALKKKQRLIRRDLSSSNDNFSFAPSPSLPNFSGPDTQLLLPTSSLTMLESEVTECKVAYLDRIAHHCRFPGMTKPCYENSEKTKDNNGQSKTTTMTPTTTAFSSSSKPKTLNQLISDTIMSTVQKCCTERCHLNELERLCCRRPDCLRECYGLNFFSVSTSNTRVPEKSANLNVKPSGIKRSFRYLSLLTQPNPIRRRHNPILANSEAFSFNKVIDGLLFE